MWKMLMAALLLTVGCSDITGSDDSLMGAWTATAPIEEYYDTYEDVKAQLTEADGGAVSGIWSANFYCGDGSVCSDQGTITGSRSGDQVMLRLESDNISWEYSGRLSSADQMDGTMHIASSDSKQQVTFKR